MTTEGQPRLALLVLAVFDNCEKRESIVIRRFTLPGVGVPYVLLRCPLSPQERFAAATLQAACRRRICQVRLLTTARSKAEAGQVFGAW